MKPFLEKDEQTDDVKEAALTLLQTKKAATSKPKISFFNVETLLQYIHDDKAENFQSEEQPISDVKKIKWLGTEG